MKRIEALRMIDVGSGVAEFDASLQKYFIETETFRVLVEDRADIVAGDKGTGKTALYKILQERYRETPGLEATEVVPAFNISGNPIFQRLTEGDPYTEAQYATLWKGYFLSLTGNWLLGIYEGVWTDSMYELDDILSRTGLRSADDSPKTIFNSIVNLFKRITNPKSAEMTVTITPEGLPIVVPKIEFGDGAVEASDQVIYHDDAYELLNRCLNGVELTAWLVMDRLDEAFAGLPTAEIPALRALLRTYLDLLPFEAVRLKLFVRNDLFRRIIEGGFVNLTHLNARKVEIQWDEPSLRDLLERRLAENEDLIQVLNLDAGVSAIDAIFPEQVDQGTRKPQTWTWMMSRIRDGNFVRPPRKLIDLVQKSKEAAIRREEREQNLMSSNEPIISSDSMKSGLRALSKERVEDTLLAEAGSLAPLVERFRNGKAEHNIESASFQLGQTGEQAKSSIEFLKEIGFLEAIGSGTLKVPMLYRDGLAVTQGKAFVTGEDLEPSNGDEDE